MTLYGEVLNALLETHLSDLNQVLLQHEITYLDFFEEWASSHFLDQMPTLVHLLGYQLRHPAGRLGPTQLLDFLLWPKNF